MHRVKKLTALILALLLCLGNVFLYVGEVRAEDFPAEEVTEEALTEEETAETAVSEEEMAENRQYDHEYKVQAVKLAKEIGQAKAANIVAQLSRQKSKIFIMN